jgi:hypothetical protein
MRSARCSRRQPSRRRCPPAPARSDNGLYVAYAHKDAAGFAAGRARVSDEAWIAMGADLSDEEYNRRMAEYFGSSFADP